MVRVVTHNIAGGEFGHGSTDALATVERQISEFAPDIVMMQEVCYTGQYVAFKQAHPTWATRFAVSRPSHPECNGGALGDMLASPTPLSNSFTVDLPYWSHDREQRILCADLATANGKALVCTVHIKAKWSAEQSEAYYGRPNGTEQRAQIQSVVDVTKPYKTRGPVIVAGDFNSPMYSGSIQPMQVEYNEVNAGTEDAGRIDHIWSGGSSVTRLNGSMMNGGLSDHPLVRGTITSVR